MTLNPLDNKLVVSSSNNTSNDKQENSFDIPLCLEDIIFICKEFSNLGQTIQKQIESILEFGVEEAIRNNMVEPKSLPHIKFFLRKIYGNPYFGDARDQAKDCFELIINYEEVQIRSKMN